MKLKRRGCHQQETCHQMGLNPSSQLGLKQSTTQGDNNHADEENGEADNDKQHHHHHHPHKKAARAVAREVTDEVQLCLLELGSFLLDRIDASVEGFAEGACDGLAVFYKDQQGAETAGVTGEAVVSEAAHKKAWKAATAMAAKKATTTETKNWAIIISQKIF